MKCVETAAIVIGLLAFMGVGNSGWADPGSARRGPFPEMDLSRAMQGAEVVAALGERLPETARWYGVSEKQFRDVLAHDGTLGADRSGRLLYSCKGDHGHGDDDPERFTIPGTFDPPPLQAPFALEQTFKLHSTPGASRVIYLDFNGHTVSKGAWTRYFNMRRINAAPLDMDGDVSTFSDRELAAIQQIWQRVTEDYAPFDVDVTTEDPGAAALTRDSSGDTAFGMRVIITSTTLESVGGIAYVGVFDEVGDDHKLVFVFSGPCSDDPTTMGEVCSHEVGHTLGLLHDGTTTGQAYYQGHGSWAPIMGGNVGQSLTQWSRGEYANANNPQDDLQVIQSHGLAPYRDDHGSKLETATPIEGTIVDQIGVIEQRTDWDFFAFSIGAGTVSITVEPAERGANLDMGVWLLDASDNAIAESTPVDSLGAALTVTLPQGDYYLAVTGMGTGDPATGYSDYASLGQYRISGSLPAGGGELPPPNTVPTAVIDASALTGQAPLEITFSAASSFDPDGQIVDWAWDFGDGSGSALMAPSHTYDTAGSYTVRLTVGDEYGATATTEVGVVVESPPVVAVSASVASIEMALVPWKRKTAVTASVCVLGSDGKPVVGATVTGVWSGGARGETSAVTDASGCAVLTSSGVRKAGPVMLSVVDVSSDSHEYDSSLNTVGSGTITVP